MFELLQCRRGTSDKIRKKGTNPRGVEITNQAINKLIEPRTTKKMEIDWSRDSSIRYNTYDRWVKYWREK